MYDQLQKYIAFKVSISNEEFEIVKEFFTPKKLRKRQYLLQEGQICRYTAFVAKGILRQYLVDGKGNEHITQFAIENWWISDRESLANQTPSNYNIDALEDSELLLITKDGVGRFQLESAQVSGISIPKSFLQELVAHGINIPGSYFDPSKPL